MGLREAPAKPGAPDTPAPWQRLDPASIANPPASGWRAVWLGHASFLLQGCGISLLVDPLFSLHCGPLPLPALKRAAPPPCRLEELPRIDAVLITHSHYDHLDLPTLQRLGRSVRILTPLGHSTFLRRKGFHEVEELAWHESVEPFPSVRLTATPAQHFTARSFRDRDLAHWCGWRIDSPEASLWHAGDSGYCPAFREIGERHGEADFGMIPIGAYQPRQLMKSMHMNPEEAVRVFLETRCRRAQGMHWGTFRLTDEAMGEPAMLLDESLRRQGIDPAAFIPGCVGGITLVSRPRIT